MKSSLEYPTVAVPAHPMVPEPWRVRRVRRETQETSTLELEPAGARPEFHCLAGQFNMLYLFGVGEVPISVSGDSNDPRKLVHTIRAAAISARAGSRGRSTADCWKRLQKRW
jgi:hypothetical protein